MSDVVAQIQKFYEHTTGLKARFSQTLSGPTGKRHVDLGMFKGVHVTTAPR